MDRTALEHSLTAAGVDLPVPADTFDALREMLALRDKWAGVHNVSGPRALAEPWWIDVLDGAAVTRALAPRLPLVDVGSGSGVPGLVVAIFEPERRVLLVEPLAKKAAFLRTALTSLRLRNVEVRRERWPFDPGAEAQLVSRAVVSPAEWPVLAARGGVHVRAILRMLAADRPPVELVDFTLVETLDYRSQAGARRIERWARRED
jgi:16S rRNA (guanine527-N7)-methyltransferase